MWALGLDSGESLSLGGEIIKKYGLHKGDEITEERILSLKSEDDRMRTMNKALELLGYRDHSRRELMDKLRQKGFGPAVEEVLEILEGKGYLNDRSFAERYFGELLHSRMIGPLLLRKKLYERGIDRGTIDELLEGVEEDVLLRNGRKLLQKKKGRYLRSQDPADLQKARAYLLQKGYDHGMVTAILRSESEDGM